VPDAKTIWLYREQLTEAGAVERLFERFDAALRATGYLAMSGQIVDATVVEARRPRTAAGVRTAAIAQTHGGCAVPKLFLRALVIR